MRQVTITMLRRTPGKVKKLALRAPVEITRRGRRAYILLSAAEFDRMKDTIRRRHASG